MKQVKVIGIVAGVLTSILGIYAMCVPMRTFLGIGWALGFLFLLNGVEMIIVAFSDKKKDIWRCILGILAAIIGLVLLFSGVQRVLTDVMAAYLVGICILAYGIYQIIAGCRNFKEKKGNSILKIVCGVLSVIMGFVSICHPLLTMISLGYVIAATLLFQGIDMIILSVAMGKNEESESD